MAPKQIRPIFETGTQGWSDRGYADGIDEQRSVGAVAVFCKPKRHGHASVGADLQIALRM